MVDTILPRLEEGLATKLEDLLTEHRQDVTTDLRGELASSLGMLSLLGKCVTILIF